MEKGLNEHYSTECAVYGQCPFTFVFNNVEIMLIFMGLSPSATVRSATVSGCGPQGSNTGLLALCTLGLGEFGPKG